MRRLLLSLALLAASVPAAATDRVRVDYMLSCQGCHLDNGRGFPERGVPDMDGFVGNFLKVPGGREFLVRVPGSAQSQLPDDRLAEVLNMILTTFSPAQLPSDFVPYTAAEVRRLRAQPLVDVARTREELVRRIKSRNNKKD